VKRGKLSFDDPLSKFMPGYPDAESAKKIRIKHLLSHTSGLGSYFNEAFMNSPTTRFRDVRSYLDVAGKEKLEFTPGTRWSYSNTGMLIAGRIIEIVSGRDYYDYIREHIYRPAGMTGTDSLALDEAPSNVAVPYELRVTDDGTAYTDASFLTPVRGSPAGGGYATASDLIKFASALRSQKLVSSATLKTLSTAKPELGSPSYGYGFDIARLAPGRDIVGHGGDFAGTCAIFDMIRDTGDPYTVVVLANSPLESCHPLASMIYETFPPVERATN
jgi:CubicO group peptidase (beta-lactamase class C family)